LILHHPNAKEQNEEAHNDALDEIDNKVLQSEERLLLAHVVKMVEILFHQIVCAEDRVFKVVGVISVRWKSLLIFSFGIFHKLLLLVGQAESGVVLSFV